MPNLSLKNEIFGDGLNHTPSNQSNKKPMQTKIATKISTKILLAIGILVVGGGIVAALAPFNDGEIIPIRPSNYTLKVVKVGSGVVVSSDGKINCVDTVDNTAVSRCSAIYPRGTAVTLTATPAKGFAFGSWSSNCSAIPGIAPACSITLNSNQTVTTTFKSLLPTVTTKPANVYGLYAHLLGSVNPNGSNTLAWFRFSYTNPGTCNDTFGVKLPIAGIQVGSGNSAVEIMTSTTDLRYSTTYYYCAIGYNGFGYGWGQLLSFTTPPPKVTLIVSKKAGSGTVTSNPKGIDCGNYCSYQFSAGTAVTLTATPATGYKFDRWFGDCVPSPAAANVCTITLGSNTTTPYYVDVSFVGLTPTVITKPADVYGIYAHLKGSVNPNGWDTTAWFRFSYTNPGTCNDTFGVRRPLTGGMQIGRGTSLVDIMDGIPDLMYSTTYYYCAIAQNTNGKSLGNLVSFTTPPAPDTYTLSVINTPSGVGSNRVYSKENPPKIDCGETCSATYANGGEVTLTAEPTLGFVFGGWGGDCSIYSTSNTCSLIMNNNKNVTATFAQQTGYTLSVTKTGIGDAEGMVYSNEPSAPKINCGSTCSAIYQNGASVILTAKPTLGYEFSYWSGDCSGKITTCTLAMTGNKSVTANFVQRTYSLNVTKAGTGVGLVSSQPPGIYCDDDCSESYSAGVPVVLTVSNYQGESIFVGWSGSCTGTNYSCNLVMDVNKSVTATFSIR